MHIFKDNVGRQWVIAINVFAVKKVKALVGLDIYSLVDEKLDGISKLLSDPCQLVDVIYCLCKEEADKFNVSDEDFGRAMGGDSLEHAANAFLEELVDFFPDPRRRAGLRKILEKVNAVTRILLDQADLEIEGIDPDSLAKTLIARSGRPLEH